MNNDFKQSIKEALEEQDLKDKLYDAFYWYYRTEYARVEDFIERENNIKINETDNAELYVQEKIEELIHTLRS